MFRGPFFFRTQCICCRALHKRCSSWPVDGRAEAVESELSTAVLSSTAADCNISPASYNILAVLWPKKLSTSTSSAMNNQRSTWTTRYNGTATATVKFTLCSICIRLPTANTIKSLTFTTHAVSLVKNVLYATDLLTVWCTLLPYGYSYKASCARPG